MEFEFDKRKSLINLKKHGIDFIEAQALWNDPDRIEIPAKTIDEERFLNNPDSNKRINSDPKSFYQSKEAKMKPAPAPQGQVCGQNEHLDSAFLPALRTLAQKLTSYVQRQVIHDSVVGIEQ